MICCEFRNIVHLARPLSPFSNPLFNEGNFRLHQGIPLWRHDLVRVRSPDQFEQMALGGIARHGGGCTAVAATDQDGSLVQSQT